MREKENVIMIKSYRFAVRIVGLYKYLQARREVVISKQLLRSGTSIGANLEEAQGAASGRDFLAKMHIVYKEIRETQYWLRLLGAGNFLSQQESASIQADCEELLRITGTIIKTLKKQHQK